MPHSFKPSQCEMSHPIRAGWTEGYVRRHLHSSQKSIFFFNNERDIECKVSSYDVLKCFLEIEKTPGKMHAGFKDVSVGPGGL